MAVVPSLTELDCPSVSDEIIELLMEFIATVMGAFIFMTVPPRGSTRMADPGPHLDFN